MKADMNPVVISSGPFTCSGDGLVCNGHKRESLEDLKAWLFPKRGSKQSLKRLKSWWQAQVRLYGLDPGDPSTTIAVLTGRLKDAIFKGLEGPPQELADLEEQLNSEFHNLIAPAREKKREAQADEVSKGQRKAKKQKVETERRVPETAKTGGYRDVVGEWSIRSPGIQEGWSVGDLRMSIFFHSAVPDHDSDDDEFSQGSQDSEPTENGGDCCRPMGKQKVPLPDGPFLWGSFDFGILEGVLCSKAAFPTSGSFPSLATPFAWRGRETGEGEIQIDYDGDNKGTITFLSSTRLQGVLESTYGTFKLVGSKVSKVPLKTDHETWSFFSESQYERERVGRWG